MHPSRRRDGVVSTEVDDQVVVYDTRAHLTHCLNDVAAQVWRLADGTRGPQELVQAVAARHGSGASGALVELALERLGDAGLLESGAGGRLRSRRELIRIAGVAAAAALVTTIAVPLPAAAASCLTNGQSCTSTPECCGGCICDGTCICG